MSTPPFPSSSAKSETSLFEYGKNHKLTSVRIQEKTHREEIRLQSFLSAATGEVRQEEFLDEPRDDAVLLRAEPPTESDRNEPASPSSTIGDIVPDVLISSGDVRLQSLDPPNPDQPRGTWNRVTSWCVVCWLHKAGVSHEERQEDGQEDQAMDET